jgi:hypothetical protein
MIKRVVVGTIVALALLGTGIAIGSHWHGWGPNHDTVVVHGTGTTGQTIVVSQAHPYGFFFFPFGLFFAVFLIFLITGVFRRRRWRGGGCGPRGPEDPGQGPAQA